MSETRMPSYHRSSLNQRQVSGAIREHADDRYLGRIADIVPMLIASVQAPSSH